MRPGVSLELAEQNVLGGCMLDAKAFWTVADLLGERDFSSRKHAAIFRAIGKLARNGDPVDAVTLADWFESNQLSELVGGSSYVIALANTTASSANIRAWAEIVRDHAIARRVREAGTKIAALQGADALAEAQSILGAVVGGMAAPTQNAKAAMRDVLRVMQAQSDRDSDLLGVSTGFPMLDDMTAGFQAGELVLVAGRPSMGKSLLAMQFAYNAAGGGIPAHIVTLEMQTDACVTRMVSAQSEISFDIVRDAKKLDDHHWLRITPAINAIGALPLYFDDDVYDLAGVLARIRQAHMQHGTRIVVVDYLQHMRLPDAQTTALAVQEVTRELKATAKALDITIILVSQLNRGLETRGDKRPVLSDLRESGAIEQDADLVLMIYRDEYHNPDSPHAGFAEVLIRKQRNGRTGMVPLRTRFDIQRFDSAPDGLPQVYRPEPTRRARGFGASFSARTGT
jgi:replicative DNA helicase